MHEDGADAGQLGEERRPIRRTARARDEIARFARADLEDTQS